MRLGKLLGKKAKGSQIKRKLPVSWQKLVLATLLIGAGIALGVMYMDNPRNAVPGAGAFFAIGGGLFLIYNDLSKGPGSGFMFADGKRKPTGRENALVLFAKRNPETGKDVPLIMRFLELRHPPKGARPHYIRNLHRHYFELINNTTTHKLEPVQLPDKKAFPPELFKIPAAMQPYKDYMDYRPPRLMEKVAPGVLLAAIGIIGFLMIVTGE